MDNQNKKGSHFAKASWDKEEKMKKIFLCGLVCLLVACNNTVEPMSGADKLVVVDTAPANCVYLYKMSAEAEFYSHDDAIQYLKNQIVTTGRSGNVVWLEVDDKQQKSWVMFGPEYKYNMVARVYDCGANFEKLNNK